MSSWCRVVRCRRRGRSSRVLACLQWGGQYPLHDVVGHPHLAVGEAQEALDLAGGPLCVTAGRYTPYHIGYGLRTALRRSYALCGAAGAGLYGLEAEQVRDRHLQGTGYCVDDIEAGRAGLACLDLMYGGRSEPGGYCHVILRLVALLAQLAYSPPQLGR